jgi:anti-sigma28 factor (negative regulator of flagellin synthesis)
MLQQDLADRNLARGLTVTEPTTRERFEEGVRGAQEAEALARAGVTGYLDDQATLARELGLDLERERDLTAAREADRDRMLERELAAGQVALDGPSRGRTTTIAGQEAGEAERIETARLTSEERRLGDQLDTDEALARIDAKSRTDIQRLINDGSYDEAEMLMGLERDMQNDRLTFEQQNLIKELKNAVTLGQIDMFGAQDLQRIINEGNLGEANTVLEGIKEQSKATVDVAVEQRGAAVDVAKEQRAGAEEIRLIDERIASEQVTSEEKVLLEELKTQIQLGTISADAAKAVQRTISQGNFNVALTQLEGTKADAAAAVDVAQEQRGAAVDVAQEQRAGAEEIRLIDERMASEQVSSEEKVLLEELKTQIQLGTISADAAKAVQRTISQGNFNVALTQLEGTKADATAAVDVAQEQRGAAVDVAQEQRAGAEEIRLIDERIASERVSSEEKVLLEELKNQISLANIDSWTSTSIQNAIIKGDYEEARQQLDYAREIAAGTVTIGGEQVPTIEAGRFNLEEQLTDAQLQQLVKTEQGMSIANLISLVQTLEPGSIARGELEAEIALQISNTVNDEALEEVLLEMLSPVTLDGETGDL